MVTKHRELDTRRNKYEQVLAVIGTLGRFTPKQLQDQCHETSSAFVSSVLKQLKRDGLVSESDSDDEVLVSWKQDDGFDLRAWIDQQIYGDQVTLQPLEDRPREQLLNLGAQQLTTSQLLAILIRSGRVGESAVQAGRKIAQYVGDRLERLRDLSPRELKSISACVSSVPYCQIMAGIELGRRVEEACQRNRPTEKITSTRAAIDYCAHHFARLAADGCQEEFHIVTLDTKLQVINRHQITVGTLDASLVHPREVFRPAIRDAAASILLVHNHPSGDPTPSREDHAVTERLKKAGEIIGIQVIDHVVVGKNRCASLADEGR